MRARILVVEDSRGMREALVQGLGEEDYEVLAEETGAGALASVAANQPDVMLLDLGLPDIDGTEVIRKLRDATNEMPILIVSARDALSARVAALDAGADDYIVKPFEFTEVLARLRSLIRRAKAEPWAPLHAGTLRLIPRSAVAEVGGSPIRLSPREREILTVLLRRREHAVSRAEILRDVFGYEFDPGTNAIDVHISHLRKKIDGAGVIIETVRGVGYRLTTASTT